MLNTCNTFNTVPLVFRGGERGEGERGAGGGGGLEEEEEENGEEEGGEGGGVVYTM